MSCLNLIWTPRLEFFDHMTKKNRKVFFWNRTNFRTRDIAVIRFFAGKGRLFSNKVKKNFFSDKIIGEIRKFSDHKIFSII